MNRCICLCFIVPLISAAPARADIFQWEYVNPTDPSQGKRQSATLAPGGAGVDAVPGAILVDRDLTMAYLANTDLTGADFSTQCYPCNGANLTDADLSQANLTGVSFYVAILDGADFSGAIVRNATFADSSFTAAQLYSTASYQAGDLSGITWTDDSLGFFNVLGGWNFAGLNLTNSLFDVGGDFSIIRLIGTDFTGADLRGAAFVESSTAINDNLIGPDGHISGLELDAGQLLIVRDYDGDDAQWWRGAVLPTPITVDEHVAIAADAALRMIFEADAWDSTISFAPGIPVALGGTLELAFADDVNLATQVGRTFDLFNWTGVTPTGAFAVSTPYAWDLTKLYTSGEVTLTAVPEPSILALTATGLCAVAMFRCRKGSYPCAVGHATRHFGR